MSPRAVLRRKQVNHVEAAAKLRAQPDTWLPIGSYWNRDSAQVITRLVRIGGRLRAYGPAGSFEARYERDNENGWTVYARFVGGAA